MTASRPLGLIAVAALLVLSGCQEGEAPAASAAGQPAPPPPQVGIVEVRPEAIPVTSELPGRIAPTRIAEVRPRVGGIVLQRIFEQGATVEEGDPLFQIDPTTFEVQVQAAQASVSRAQAVLGQATAEAERTRSLVRSNTVSTANLDTVLANQQQAEADLAAARAQLREAEINLDYATVRAPISGRIGRALVTEGALVSMNSAEALATIQQIDPVYADIQQPVTELLRLRAALASGELTQIEPDVARVRLRLDDGTLYGPPGRLLFSEATVEPDSGQVTLRAEFPNGDDTLLPGMYVRVSVDQGVEPSAFAVPNQAIQRDTAGRALLYVVNAENTVEARPVTVARVEGNRSVIDSGLEAGERVIADGFQKTGPGAPVTPVPWQEDEAASDAAPVEGGEETISAEGASAEEPSTPPAPADEQAGEGPAEEPTTPAEPAEGEAGDAQSVDAVGTPEADAPVPSAAPRRATAQNAQ